MRDGCEAGRDVFARAFVADILRTNDDRSGARASDRSQLRHNARPSAFYRLLEEVDAS